LGNVISDCRGLQAIDNDYVYYISWGDKNYFRYNTITKSTENILTRDYQAMSFKINKENSYLLNILSGVYKDDNLYMLLFDDEQNIYFKSKDNQRISSINKNDNSKKEIFNAANKNEQIKEVYWLLE
jgi:hypothetical protein